jgi:hypothetical protein
MKRSDVYKAIRDKLLADIPGLTVDVDRGQMTDPKAEYPIPIPLALVNFSKIKWEVIATGLERGSLTISVDYFKVIASGMFSGAEAEDETLELLDSPDEIYQSLKYYSIGELFSELNITEESEIKAGGRLIGYRVTFSANVFQGE